MKELWHTSPTFLFQPFSCSFSRFLRFLWLIAFILSVAILLPSPILPYLLAEVSQPLNKQSIPTGLTADQLIEFADHLMHDSEYFRAITEYRRFLFLYPQDPRQAMIHFRVGLALYRGQQYAEALQTFQEIAQRYSDTPYGKQAWLWQGESLLRQAQYKAAEQTYMQIIERFPDDETTQVARYQRGWALLYQRQWHAASLQLQQITPESSLYRMAHQLAEEVLDGDQLPSKSPLIAGILSGMLPGSGQLYNGRVGDALLAFFLNGLFITGIAQAITHQELAVAGVLSFFEAGWYAGNVYGAINGAHKHNRRAEETFLRNLENRYRFQPQEGRQSQMYGFQLGLTF
jgi:tetratricopeptide (TPR) repeat protein